MAVAAAVTIVVAVAVFIFGSPFSSAVMLGYLPNRRLTMSRARSARLCARLDPEPEDLVSTDGAGAL